MVSVPHFPFSMDESLSPVSGNPSVSDAAAVNWTDLRAKLYTGTENTRLQAIADLSKAGTEGLNLLQEFLVQSRDYPPTWIEGRVYQVLRQADRPAVNAFLNQQFPTGIVPLSSAAQIDYTALQQALADQDFQAADCLTLEKLCELAGPAAVRRKWLYFSEVDRFPVEDLRTINLLWLVHSEGRFGYSVQRQLWLGVNRDWDALWPRIGWRDGKKWTRYPQEFIWDLSAPKGHLPLSNQLRGVQVINALLNHPAWQS
uniref:GUN4 domain protein n=1 Tax=Cyanothece sp. (strain PCC 7425 / ATCC 29141) TaxID=395961 RepID=B8HLF4_CYAP4